MPLWKFVPAAHPTDPRWQGRPMFSEVIVRADSAGMARRVAGAYELPVSPEQTMRAVGNGSEPLGSALEDEKLYRMKRMGETDAAFVATLEREREDGGGEGVLRAVRAPRPVD